MIENLPASELKFRNGHRTMSRLGLLFAAFCSSELILPQTIHQVVVDANGAVHYLNSIVNQYDPENRRTGLWIAYSDASVQYEVAVMTVVDSTVANHVDVISSQPGKPPLTNSSLEWIRHEYYSRGLAEGIWTTYARNGSVKILCLYDAGILTSGVYFYDTGEVHTTIERFGGMYRMQSWARVGSLLSEKLISQAIVSQTFPPASGVNDR